MASHTMSSRSAVHATRFRHNAPHISRRSSDELFHEITNKVSQEQVHLSATLLAGIRAILNQAIVTTDLPQNRLSCTHEPVLVFADTPRPNRSSQEYAGIPDSYETGRHGVPQDVNQAFSFSHEDLQFQEFFPHVDLSTYSSEDRKAARGRAAEQAAERARVKFDANEARERTDEREARQANRVREAEEALDRQAAQEAFKKNSKGKKSTTQKPKKRVSSKTTLVVKTKNDEPFRTTKVTTTSKPFQPARPSQLSRSHSAYPEQECNELAPNPKTVPPESSNNALATAPDDVELAFVRTEPTVSNTLSTDGNLNNYSNDNTKDELDDNVVESVEEGADNIIIESTNIQVSVPENTSTAAEASESIVKVFHFSQFDDSTYGSQLHNQGFLDLRAQESTNAVPATSSRIIKTPVDPSSRNSPQAVFCYSAPPSSMPTANSTHPSTSTFPTLSQSSGSGRRATSVEPAISPDQFSFLGKRARDSTADEDEPAVKKTKPSE
ncbi:hypothetical protein T440DRAFT_553668 [Plenodomus tracheiphilus IPT5]|uniref:Uncharacterized protein n=1 Tax=Plenodomus tracheiphilus IPT5 TaxID=1408161 RepID=A0A6A7BA46_9PLEO|nr:hypothetical protein T440DRAFT_553668 [Plenodomus tracheiphilus IPT5]